MFTPYTALSTLSLHDALPISIITAASSRPHLRRVGDGDHTVPASSIERAENKTAFGPPIPLSNGTSARQATAPPARSAPDRKSTRLNSSHEWISYAVFCLKKK